MQDQVGSGEIEREVASKPICGQGETVDVRIELAPLDSSDNSLIREWRNDYRIWQWCRQNDLISDVEQQNWFEKQSKDPSIKMYKIVLAVKGEAEWKNEVIGVCGLTSISLVNRTAEFSIYIKPATQGNGFGQKAMFCLLNHGFKNIGLNVIWGEVFAGNPAIEKFEKIGFKREGLRRDFYFRDGKFIDAHIISIKASEWIASTSS